MPCSLLCSRRISRCPTLVASVRARPGPCRVTKSRESCDVLHVFQTRATKCHVLEPVEVGFALCGWRKQGLVVQDALVPDPRAWVRIDIEPSFFIAGDRVRPVSNRVAWRRVVAGTTSPVSWNCVGHMGLAPLGGILQAFVEILGEPGASKEVDLVRPPHVEDPAPISDGLSTLFDFRRPLQPDVQPAQRLVRDARILPQPRSPLAEPWQVDTTHNLGM